MRVENAGAAPVAPGPVPVAGGALSEDEKKSLKEACSQFEAFFWEFMLSESGMGKVGDSSGSMLGTDYSSVMREEVSRSLSRSGSLGIADVIYRSLINNYGGPDDAR
jgi:Rod binding domain-containing protein